MKHITLACAVLAFAGAAHAQTPQKSAAECGVEPLSHYLKMSPEEFNQSPQGWRSIGNAQTGCDIAAADLIAAYHADLLKQAAAIQWHEAQGRAWAGQNTQALELFKLGLAYELSMPEERRSYANIYKVEATVAFMENDLPRLRKARDNLAAVPMPEGLAESIAKHQARYPAQPSPTWPPNLDAVEGLIRCFGQPYAKAWTCRTQ